VRNVRPSPAEKKKTTNGFPGLAKTVLYDQNQQGTFGIIAKGKTHIITCTRETSEGFIAGAKQALTILTFTGCESGGIKYHSEGAAEGEAVTQRPPKKRSRSTQSFSNAFTSLVAPAGSALLGLLALWARPSGYSISCTPCNACNHDLRPGGSAGSLPPGLSCPRHRPYP
jgi:hypothetical protein